MEEKRATRRVYRGIVVSDKMDKTIIVSTTVSRSAGMYGKRTKYTKKFVAHDENNEAKKGDTVEIMETRPLSATKRYRLVKVVEKAVVL